MKLASLAVLAAVASPVFAGQLIVGQALGHFPRNFASTLTVKTSTVFAEEQVYLGGNANQTSCISEYAKQSADLDVMVFADASHEQFKDIPDINEQKPVLRKFGEERMDDFVADEIGPIVRKHNAERMFNEDTIMTMKHTHFAKGEDEHQVRHGINKDHVITGPFRGGDSTLKCDTADVLKPCEGTIDVSTKVPYNFFFNQDCDQLLAYEYVDSTVEGYDEYVRIYADLKTRPALLKDICLKLRDSGLLNLLGIGFQFKPAMNIGDMLVEVNHRSSRRSESHLVDGVTDYNSMFEITDTVPTGWVISHEEDGVGGYIAFGCSGHHYCVCGECW